MWDREGAEMRRNRLAVIGSALVLASALAAGTAAGGAGGSPAAPAAVAPPPPTDADDFAPELFDATSATIDNPFLPLPPGTRWVWRGRAFEDGQRVERKVIFTVTDLTKVVAGVRTRVGWDRDFNDGVLGEGELIFLAQDIYGNVWHLGQYRETFDEEEFVGGRVWVVGDPVGAEAGLMMLADHEVGDTYSQGFAPPPWNWDDHARVIAVGEHTCVPVGCFDDVLVVKEFEPTKPGAYQLKYYAPGVGNVRVGWGGRNEEEREVMVLVKWFELTPEALAAARERALEMEHRAYAYGRTDPAEPG
jgi:hypothetical protein